MSSETVELSERVELSSDAAEVSLEVSAALDSPTAEETEAVLSVASPPSPATEAYTMPPVRQASTTTMPTAKATRFRFFARRLWMGLHTARMAWRTAESTVGGT